MTQIKWKPESEDLSIKMGFRMTLCNSQGSSMRRIFLSNFHIYPLVLVGGSEGEGKWRAQCHLLQSTAKCLWILGAVRWLGEKGAESQEAVGGLRLEEPHGNTKINMYNLTRDGFTTNAIGDKESAAQTEGTLEEGKKTLMMAVKGSSKYSLGEAAYFPITSKGDGNTETICASVVDLSKIDKQYRVHEVDEVVLLEVANEADNTGELPEPMDIFLPSMMSKCSEYQAGRSQVSHLDPLLNSKQDKHVISLLDSREANTPKEVLLVTPSGELSIDRQADHSGAASMATSILKMESKFGTGFNRFVSQVGPYTVKSDLAPILEAIMDMHGDIARDCLIPPSHSLEEICQAMQDLQQVSLKHLRSYHLLHLSLLLHYESLGINLKWLRGRHDHLQKIVDMVRQYKSKGNLAQKLKELELIKAAVVLKRESLAKMKVDLKSLEGQLESSVSEIEKKKCSLRKIASECNSFKSESLVDGLFQKFLSAGLNLSVLQTCMCYLEI
ncbi:hypothetical protein Ancab_036303 [Ancistrocladus abbreviatus]